MLAAKQIVGKERVAISLKSTVKCLPQQVLKELPVVSYIYYQLQIKLFNNIWHACFSYLNIRAKHNQAVETTISIINGPALQFITLRRAVSLASAALLTSWYLANNEQVGSQHTDGEFLETSPY